MQYVQVPVPVIFNDSVSGVPKAEPDYLRVPGVLKAEQLSTTLITNSRVLRVLQTENVEYLQYLKYLRLKMTTCQYLEYIKLKMRTCEYLENFKLK